MNEYPNATNVTRYLNTTTNHLINPNRSNYYYEHAIGIKTGYTNAAANCIVAGAAKDGVELIVVIFGASGWGNLREDTVNLFEYGFSMLKSEPLAVSGTVIDTMEIENGEKNQNILEILIEDTLFATIHNMEDSENYEPVISLNADIKAPIEAGTVVGTVTYSVNDNSYSSNLIAGNSIIEKTPIIETAATVVKNTATTLAKIVLWTILTIVIIFIAIVFLRAYIMTKNQRKRSRRRYMYNSRFR
jgi:D-alanyl-D-alanine carboxypeptidase (penicillin-binding protein 5/6)